MKPYSDLSDIEKGWIQEYKSWRKCDIIPLKLEMLTQYQVFLESHELNIHDYIK